MDEVAVLESLQFRDNVVNDMIDWHCPVSHHVSHVSLAHDYEKSATGDFKILYCKQCDLGFTHRIPTEETAHFL